MMLLMLCYVFQPGFELYVLQELARQLQGMETTHGFHRAVMQLGCSLISKLETVV